jgi:hypothetical protein
LFFCCDLTAASMSAFIPTILTELGWTAKLAQAMSIPVWLCGIATQLSGAWLSARTGLRFPFILSGILLVLIGWSINIAYSKGRDVSAGVRYLSLFLMSAGTFLQMTLTTSWLANNLRGRASLAMGTAIILGIGNCANFVSSNVFIKHEAPYYPTAFTTGLGITVAGALLCLFYLGLLWQHNRKLNEKRSNSSGVDVLDDHLAYKYQY